MQRSARAVNTGLRIEQLEARHRTLKQQISTLDEQRFLTDYEQSHMHALKKLRLAAKDELSELQRGNASRQPRQ